jgi:hypothetical protein
MRFPVNGLVISLLYLVGSWENDVEAFQVVTHKTKRARCLTATLTETDAAESALKGVILEQMSSGVEGAKEYSEMFGFSETEAGLYGLFDAMRKAGIAYGLKGRPFVLRKEEITQALGGTEVYDGFFTMKDLEKALEDDFLDASRGSTDNRKGWKVRG